MQRQGRGCSMALHIRRNARVSSASPFTSATGIGVSAAPPDALRRALSSLQCTKRLHLAHCYQRRTFSLPGAKKLLPSSVKHLAMKSSSPSGNAAGGSAEAQKEHEQLAAAVAAAETVPTPSATVPGVNDEQVWDGADPLLDAPRTSQERMLQRQELEELTDVTGAESAAAAEAAEVLHPSVRFLFGRHDQPLPPQTAGELLPNDQLDQLTARAYFERPIVGLGVHHFAAGSFRERLGEDEYLIEMDEVSLSPIVEVSSRVHVRLGQTDISEGRVAGGIVAKVNSDGTFGVLLDDNKFITRMPPDQIVLVEGRSRFTLERPYLDMMEWFRDAGVPRHADRERICSMLYQRGWRENRLYLLEGADVHCMTYLKKSVRLAVLEKAEWQRMHHAEMRALLRERVKEREWRYFVQKFSGFVSANWAGLGVLSVFLWNFKNYRKQQRAYQMKYAVNTLTSPGTRSTKSSDEHGVFVRRTAEENWARQILRQLDITRPRVAVLTGSAGCGKSSLFRTAISKENKPALFVEVRRREDALACVLKSLKVPNPDACGDYLDFISDAFTRSTKINGEPPIVAIKLREGSSLERVYNETAVLACDRMLCHLVFEVSLEALTVANVTLPRVDFYHVPNFTPKQAMQYTQHTLDPVSMRHFIEVVGTNSNDLDELFAAVHHRKTTVMEYTNNKLAKAMRQVHAAWSSTPEGLHNHDMVVNRHHNHHNSAHSTLSGSTSGSGSASAEDDPVVKAALVKLAEAGYSTGQHTGVDVNSLRHPSLRDIVLYDPVQDRWLFKHQVLHTAVRSSL